MNTLDYLKSKLFGTLNLFLISIALIGLSACGNNTKNQIENQTDSKPFISIWKTDSIYPKGEHAETGSENLYSLKIPLKFASENWRIDWGDGKESNASDFPKRDRFSVYFHTYKTKGTYTIKIYAESFSIKLFDYDYCSDHECLDGPYRHDTDDQKLLSIEQWGKAKWTSFEDAFNGCANLIVKATDTPYLYKVDSLSRMFKGIKGVDGESLGSWDVSTIKSMDGMLENVTLPTDFYDNILIEWNKLYLQKYVNFNAGNSRYSSASASSRDYLTTFLNWKISDGGGEEIVADAGQNIIKEKDSIITLDASKSYSREGNISSYEWKYQDNILSTDRNFTISKPLDVGRHIITLTVTDSNGLEAKDKKIIDIIPKVEEGGNAVKDDYANNSTNATVIELYSLQRAVFETEDDVDFFKINVPGAGELGLEIIDGVDSVESQIFDADGNMLARDYYDGFRMLSNKISLNVEPGVYYIRTSTYEEAYEDNLEYSFRITLTPDSN